MKTKMASETSSTSELNGLEMHFSGEVDSDDYSGSRSHLGPRRSGFHVSPILAAAYILLAILVAVGVGLIVYFAHPGESCEGCYPTPPPTAELELIWEKCVNLSHAMNQCFPDLPHCPDEPPTLPPEEVEPLSGLILPRWFRPRHYQLHLFPNIYEDDPEDFKLEATVTITLEVLIATDVVILHNHLLNTSKENITVKRDVERPLVNVVDYEADAPRQQCNITLDSALAVGEIINVTLSYTGPIPGPDGDKYGLYWSSYKEGDQARYLAATQFSPTYARRMFPCIDEPEYKATFDTTIKRRPAPWFAVANGPLLNSEDNGEWIVDTFERTLTMATYLVAITVVDGYDSLSQLSNGGMDSSGTQFGGKNMTYYARPEAVADEQLNYTMYIGPLMLDYFETLYDFEYPMAKMDKFAVPDFAFGAMENWGLVTYRESRILDDPLYMTSSDVKSIAVTMAHEIVHQWFGNLVGFDWFSDLWLKEGFATYFSYSGVKASLPAWSEEQLLIGDSLWRALREDSSGQSHPMHHDDVYTPEEIRENFDYVAYDKASVVIRMADHLMLRENFLDACREYLETYQYSVANYEMLLSVWEKHTPDTFPQEVNVTEAMKTWILQQGFPLVTFWRESPTEVKVTQLRYLEDPQRPLPEDDHSIYNYMFEIPIEYITSQDRSPQSYWLHKTNGTLRLAAELGDEEWILGNYGAQGFYRVNYDDSNWNALIEQMHSDFSVFSISNRAQLLDDSFHLARSGEIFANVSMKLTEYLKNETEWLPWKATSDGVQYVDKMMYKTPDYSMLLMYMQTLLNKIYDGIGWDILVDDGDIVDKILQQLILQLACKYEIPSCVQTSMELMGSWMEDPDDLALIRPDFRKTVYCTAIRHGTSGVWDFLYEQYRNEWQGPSGVGRTVIRDSLGCSSQPWILRRLMNLALDNSSAIQESDRKSVVESVARNPVGENIAWDYLLDLNLDRIYSLDVLEELATVYSTQIDLAKVQKYMEEVPAKSWSEQRRYDDVVYEIEANIRWRHRNDELIKDWLNGVG